MKIADITVGTEYVMTTVSKANQASKYQPKTIVKDDKAYQTTQICVTSVKDSGDYFYVGYVPSGEDSQRCGFGYARIYKDSNNMWGVINFEPIVA